MDRKTILERTIMGLEMSIPDMQSRIKYYPPDDLEGRYAKKFLSSMEENLEKARQELSELRKKDEPGPERA